MEFKDKVKIAREKLVLSQTEFAKELGVAFASVKTPKICRKKSVVAYV